MYKYSTFSDELGSVVSTVQAVRHLSRDSFCVPVTKQGNKFNCREKFNDVFQH